MLQSIVRFSNDAAAIEKTLRGFQGFATIAVGLAHDIDFWLKLRAQLALGTMTDSCSRQADVDEMYTGRRYFRLLKWHPCWQSASEAAGNTEYGSLRRTLEVVKFAFLGMYFFLEMFTIVSWDGMEYCCIAR